MGKQGAPKKEWMTEDEAATLLNNHITRTTRTFEVDWGVVSYTELELESIEVFEYFYALVIKKLLKESDPSLYDKVNNLTLNGITSWFLTLCDGLDDDKYIDIKEAENLEHIEEDTYIIDKSLWFQDLELHSNICDEIDAELELANTLKLHYKYLADYLREKGIENNIDDYYLSLSGEGFHEVIRHIKIEKKAIFTPLMTKDMKRELCRSNFGCTFDISECFKLVSDGLNPLVIVSCESHFAYLMQELEKRGFVYNNWKATIGKYKLARSKWDYKKFYSKKNLSPLLTQVNDEYATSENSEVAKTYKEIRDFVRNL